MGFSAFTIENFSTLPLMFSSTNATDQLKEYLGYLQANPNGEEIQYRTAFENFFNKSVPAHLAKRNITAIQEDRRSGIEIEGTPDFFVYEDYGSLFKKLVGFIECKKPAYKLEKLIESEQIKKYAKTCENIIITNYRRFILLQKGRVVHDVELSGEQIQIQKFENLLRDFYGYDYPYIKTKKTLVSALAAQSFYYSVALREFIASKENEADNFYVKFNALFGEYQKSISYHYELDDFCDIYSQSLVYGLMLSCIDTGKKLDEKELDYLRGIPGEYKLLYEFLSQAYENRDLPTSIKIALINIGKNINLISIEDIQNEFAKTNNGKQNIVVYLYEDFLQEYDNLRKTENREDNGVYYTPIEVANFIARNVNGIIKAKFSMRHGYLSPNVKILDFACGTGTFLHSVFEQLLGECKDDLDKPIAENKITKDIYGFELLFTPYIIAHTVLTRFLKKNGIKMGNERLGIYLTNTLDISQHSISSLLPSLKKEYEKAMDIKDREQILAIVGNPPYFNGRSKAEKGMIDSKLNEYKKDLNEKKINLDDLYIKFIRFAEWKIERYGEGVIGIITNNSYLYGKTHRQMRKHLYETFDEIFILNLHGDMDRKENDQNIFDIKRGVCIAFFIKNKKPQKKNIHYFSTLKNKINSRQEKLAFLENTELSNIQWKKLNPAETENYWFTEKDFSGKSTYKNFWKLTDIFKNTQSCVKTDRDKLVINYNKINLEKNMRTAFSGNYPKEFKEKYDITNSSGYNFADKLKEQKFDENAIIDCIYRPFDIRKIYYKIGFTSRPAKNVAKHLINHDNIGIVFKKQLNRNVFNTIIVVDKIPDVTILETSHGNAFLAPLYLYPDEGGKLIGKAEKIPNFTDKFKEFLKTLDFKPSPEKILAYIYAALHSPSYRKKYIEFLKTDFPAVPFAQNKTEFEKLAKLGQKLIDLHLLKNLPDDKEIKTSNIPQTNFTIESIHHSNDQLILHTTQKQNISFSGITSKIYDFEIGSYKPIDKWLKYRIKDSVSLCPEDLKHLKEMIIAIKGTLEVVEDVDGA
ncbi:DNA methyltransferase [Fibrobacteria bacterium R8-3-H12]